MKRLLTAAATVALLVLTGAAPGAQAATAGPRPFIRVDQVGYASSEAKRAYLLAPHALAGTKYTVRDRDGRVLLTGRVGPSAGGWNATYQSVQPIDFTALGVPGTYTIEAAGAVSPTFKVGFGWDLFGPLAAETTHELSWLDKMWDAKHKVLYVQVGIGSGSEALNLVGDHDVWRLPEADDALNTEPGDPDYFVKFRPVFAAAKPGQKITP